MNYTIATEVEEVARPILEKYHNELTPVRIFYLFQDEPIKKKGKQVLGEIKKITGLNAFLANTGRGIEDSSEFLVMTVHGGTWNLLEPHQKKALVDHELTHATIDFSSGKLVMCPHDLEEFNIIVARHGLWMSDVEQFIKAAKQPSLFIQHWEEEREAAMTPPSSPQPEEAEAAGEQPGKPRLRKTSKSEDLGEQVGEALAAGGAHG